MKGQRIGYIRVSSFDQNPNRQLDGIATDRAFIDKASGKSIDRPQLEEMLRFAREGDIIIVHSMDRLARNLDDLRTLVRNLTSKGIDIQFCKEQLTFTNNDSPMSQLLLSVMGAFAEFERALLGVVAKNSIGRISPRRFLKLRVNYLDIKESIHEGGSLPHKHFTLILT